MKRGVEFVSQCTHSSIELEVQQSKREKVEVQTNASVLHQLPQFFVYLSPFELFNFSLTCKDAILFISSHPNSMDSWCIRNRNRTQRKLDKLWKIVGSDRKWHQSIFQSFMSQYQRLAFGLATLYRLRILPLSKVKQFSFKIQSSFKSDWNLMLNRSIQSAEKLGRWNPRIESMIANDNLDPIFLKPFFNQSNFCTMKFCEILSIALKSPTDVVLQKLCLYVRRSYRIGRDIQYKDKQKSLKFILDRFPEKFDFDDFPNLRIVTGALQAQLSLKNFKYLKKSEIINSQWQCPNMIFYEIILNTCDTSGGKIPFEFLLETYANGFSLSGYGFLKYFENSKYPKAECEALACVIPETTFFSRWFWANTSYTLLKACTLRFRLVPDILTKLPTEAYFFTLPLLIDQWSDPTQRSAFEMICGNLNDMFVEQFWEVLGNMDRNLYIPLEFIDLMLEYGLDHRLFLYATKLPMTSSLDQRLFQKPCLETGREDRFKAAELYNLRRHSAFINKSLGCTHQWLHTDRVSV